MTNEPNQPKERRRPDYALSVMNTKTGGRGKVGAAWREKDGSIQIRLNPMVTLTDAWDHVLMLFPNDGVE